MESPQRRYLTAQDIRQVQGGEIVVDENTLVTPQAVDVAREQGIAIRTAKGEYRSPTPDRGPDAERATYSLPHLPEPSDPAERAPRVVVTAVGRNRRGVLAELTAELSAAGANVHDVSQKVIEGFFHLILVCELEAGVGFAELQRRVECLGGQDDYSVRVMHERVFRFMHRI